MGLIDADASGAIDRTEFIDFFYPFMMPDTEFKRTLAAIVLRLMMVDQQCAEQAVMLEAVYSNLIRDITGKKKPAGTREKSKLLAPLKLGTSKPRSEDDEKMIWGTLELKAVSLLSHLGEKWGV